MTKNITHLPCLSCSSSDALTYYPEDGHSFCFSCSTYFPKEKEKEIMEMMTTPISSTSIQRTLNEIEVTNSLVSPYRGLNRETLKKFKVISGEVNNNQVVVFPTSNGAAKVRKTKEKAFWTVGPYSDSKLFGMEVFDPGSAKAITITEGELDALSVYQMLGGYPVVSVKNGAKGAAKDCAQHREYINSFPKIYLCFDNDEKGKEATAEVARLFDSNKVYIVEMTKFKDANEYLDKGASQEFVKVWWAAQRFRPRGVISSFEEIDAVLDTEDAQSICDYPFATVNDMALGIRSSEVILVTAETGVGKTEYIRAIEYKVLKETDFNIGVIHLEEREKRAIMGLATYELSRPVHRPDSGVSREEIKAAFRKVVKRDDRVYFYQHFGSEDPDIILDIVRHLVTAGNCKFIFLDHITMLVTGFEGDDERKRLDYLSTRFAVLTRELDFTLFLVSHVNDDGRTRGSRNIEKIADLWLHVERDKEHPDPEVRNTMKVTVKKNRFAGETGPGGLLKFDTDTYKLEEKTVPDPVAIDERIKNEGTSMAQPKFLEEPTIFGLEGVFEEAGQTRN